MRTTTRAILIAISSIALAQALGGTSVRAQASAATGSLGGYGGSISRFDSGMAGGPVIPYVGRFGGFIPYRMSGTGSLSFQSRGASSIGSPRTSFTLSPMSGSMGSGFGPGSRMFSPFGSQGGMGLGAGKPPSMQRDARMSVMPPSFGYPFRQPPSLLSPSSSGAGMSM